MSAQGGEDILFDGLKVIFKLGLRCWKFLKDPVLGYGFRLGPDFGIEWRDGLQLSVRTKTHEISLGDDSFSAGEYLFGNHLSYRNSRTSLGGFFDV